MSRSTLPERPPLRSSLCVRIRCCDSVVAFGDGAACESVLYGAPEMAVRSVRLGRSMTITSALANSTEFGPGVQASSRPAPICPPMSPTLRADISSSTTVPTRVRAWPRCSSTEPRKRAAVIDPRRAQPLSGHSHAQAVTGMIFFSVAAQKSPSARLSVTAPRCGQRFPSRSMAWVLCQRDRLGTPPPTVFRHAVAQFVQEQRMLRVVDLPDRVSLCPR